MKAACDPGNCSESQLWPVVMYTEENRPVTEKESHNRNSDAASEKSLELVVFSKEQAETLTLFFFLTRRS